METKEKEKGVIAMSTTQVLELEPELKMWVELRKKGHDIPRHIGLRLLQVGIWPDDGKEF